MLFPKTFPLFLANSVRSAKLECTQVTCLVLVRLLNVLSNVFRFRVPDASPASSGAPAARQQEGPARSTRPCLLPGQSHISFLVQRSFLFLSA